MEKFIVKKQIALKAKPGQVWDALTNPEKTKQYFFNSKVYSNWEKGSEITFKGKFFFFIKFEMSGIILEIEPQKLLKYTLSNSKSSSTSTVTDEITYENRITTLSITDDVGQGEGAEKRFKKSDKGWNKILAGLQDLIESENSDNR
jgi:uncharacterized protein YndB with AHSA1/START domain